MPTHPTCGNILQEQRVFKCKIANDANHDFSKRFVQPQMTWMSPVALKTYLVEDNPTIRDNLIATLE